MTDQLDDRIRDTPDATDAAAAAREARLERRCEYDRRWRKENHAKVRAYRLAYDAAHRDQVNAAARESSRRVRERARAEGEQERLEEERRERKRQASRDWYARNKDRHLESQRKTNARKKAEDPDKYRVDKAARTKKWADANREAVNARLRAKYREDPSKKAEAARDYYERNAEKVKARRRAYYAANRERQLEAQARWRAREKRRTELGLPPTRLHRTTAAERKANAAAADAFFARQYTPPQIRAIREQEPAPSREALDRWERESARARAASFLADDPTVRAALSDTELRHIEATERRRREREQQDSARAEREQLRREEEERLDAVARQVNERFRRGPRPPEQYDPAHPPAFPSSPSRGLGL
ncbi:hypothetical protein [Microbacterium thalassium]|uniref:Uncharacterized protein n=1 Tax=Microbacterium thalassium TaxID=362649 RepID=A0A7X0KTF5_9MICO|nr:hypothetical protein [Microbacterium thalassium]MBB6390003.1 hypothetical protein [Microbacterium thalassium]GLK24689.1 hypothetical protein GCM10017607_20070 [Microbacterium thalassium]